MPTRVILIIGCVLAILAGLAFVRWDGKREGIAEEKPKTELATDDATARGLEAQGERDTSTRVEVVVRQAAEAARYTSELAQEAREAPDANTPINPDRLDRLRRHDERLCQYRPSLDGCDAPAPLDAGAGE